MYLSELFKNAPSINIEQLSCDSRVPMKDCIYFCVKGIKYNGHEFVDEAIDNGANVIVYSDDIDISRNAIFIKVNNVDDVLNQVSSKFYDYPASKLETYIVGGTKGRSSVTSIINDLLKDIKKCCSIGVMGINDGDNLLLSNQATLTILDTQKSLDTFVKNDCKVCTLEAKTLALSYKKLDMINPNVFIYTTTSFESNDYKELGLDFTDSLKRYLYTLDNNTICVLNRDDSTFNELYNAAGDNKVSYGKNIESNYLISDIKYSNSSTSFNLTHGTTFRIKTSLLGEANVYNLTASLVALFEMGYDKETIINSIYNIERIDGVYDRLNFDDYNIIVDNASTSDSYKTILDYAKEITNDNNKIYTIISCNSSDSASKIKPIVEIADNNSDEIILTVDDTYEDNGQEILDTAASFISKHNYLAISDREGAIEEAIELLNSGDTLLILGKGNETFMYQGLVKKSYNGDKNVAYKYMNKRLKEENTLF